ncbi:MAG TPA: TetR/AcrR family transcriptional regulator [Chitinophaga sp.]|uniref:TetR/AcrR family transcriptional regulator n=1 Tax=Chitinophaga sp. TaxID=1869181 RepID=UPI002D02DDDA|nr:TetR/AcrR family transcriptional regulator [Chitinophaga sp.]HVI47804.1 TetR/AcrR family transcriptional regulator [Chitinophaga sp.]
MTDTKAKIREAALKLFNEHGIDAITIRHIAKELGISHGNVQYHYKNTNDIILTLFNQLTDDMTAYLAKGDTTPLTTFREWREKMESLFDVILHYRFIFLHFVEVVRRVPSIKTIYNSWDKPREQQFMQMFGLMKDQGIFRKDLPDQVWKDLITQMYIFGDFFLSHNEIKLNLKGKKAVKHYGRIFSNLFYPYLTPKGRQQADELNA